jgi:hypothetical protein
MGVTSYVWFGIEIGWHQNHMKRFNFRKRVMRNDFTIVFGGIGKRRTLLDFVSKKSFRKRWIRFKMVQIRRAHQGRKNKVFGSIHALRIRRAYGRRKPIGSFRR